MKQLRLFLFALLFGFSPAYAMDEIAAMGYHRDDIRCLARVIYHETRGEPKKGKLGVAKVTFNRTEHAEFPSTICRVIAVKNAYPWYHKLRTPYKSAEYVNAESLAVEVFVKEKTGVKWAPKSVENALFFNGVPFNLPRLTYATRIGGHLFYNMKDRRR